MDESRVDPSTLLTISANGHPRSVQADSTVGDLLRELAIAPARVIVQLDGAIVPRPDFAHTKLHEGSRLEILTIVGGG